MAAHHCLTLTSWLPAPCWQESPSTAPLSSSCWRFSASTCRWQPWGLWPVLCWPGPNVYSLVLPTGSAPYSILAPHTQGAQGNLGVGVNISKPPLKTCMEPASVGLYQRLPHPPSVSTNMVLLLTLAQNLILTTIGVIPSPSFVLLSGRWGDLLLCTHLRGATGRCILSSRPGIQ